MIKYNKKLIILEAVIIIIVILAAIGLTYAFFVANVEGNDLAEPTIVETSNLKLLFNDTEVITMNETLPGASQTKIFTVSNIGNSKVYYDINIIDVINTFENGDLVYTISSTNGGGTATNISFPLTDETLVSNIEIASGVIQEYTIVVKFKETGTNQDINQGASFSGKLQINSKVVYSEEEFFEIEETIGESFVEQTKTVNLISTYYGDVSCTSSELEVATCSIEDGKLCIQALNNGLSNITVRENTKSIELIYSINVKDVVLGLEKTSGAVLITSTKNINIIGDAYGTLSCETSDASKATCSIEGTTLKITGIAEGAVNVTIRESTRNKSAIYSATVITGVYVFDYTGNYQTFVIPFSSSYKLEIWGAQGAGSSGKGGYSTGISQLQKGTNLYIYVGGQGSGRTGGYNGGGTGGTSSGSYYGTSSGGGGASDIRLISGLWSNASSLNSRLIIAGGGGGTGGSGYHTYNSTIYPEVKGGASGVGGGLTSTAGVKGSGSYTTGGEGGGSASQSAGGALGIATRTNFGSSNSDTWIPGGGGAGGGGWYGGGGGGGGSNAYAGLGSPGIAGIFGIGGNGGAGRTSSTGWYEGGGGGGAGGSGYVLTSTSYKPSGYNPNSKYYMISDTLIAGNTTMPNPSGGTMTGKTGNGYARITYIEE